MANGFEVWRQFWITVWALGCPVYIGRRLASRAAADMIITWGLHNPFVSVLCPLVSPFVPLVPRVPPWFPSHPSDPLSHPIRNPNYMYMVHTDLMQGIA